MIDSWLQEDPDNPDARFMRARVSVDRAVRAARQGLHDAGRWEQQARVLSAQAAQCNPSDPGPYVCLLHLAQLDVGQQRREHRFRFQWDPLLPSGPWQFLYESDRRHPYSREAYVRSMQFVRAIGRPEYDLGAWAASVAPEGSPLRVLPLYGWVREANFQESHGPWRHEWCQETARDAIDRIFQTWFRCHSDPRRQCAVEDLSHLALALWASRQLEQAHEVFEVMAPYAALGPWLSIAGGDRSRAEQMLHQARRDAHYIPRSRGFHGDGHRARHAQPSRPRRGVGRLFGGSSS